MLADTSNYDLQNIEYQSQNPIKVTKVLKENNYEP